MPDHGFKVGDRVVLLRLDDWFFNKLEPTTVSFLKACVGQETLIADFDDYGHAELEFTDRNAAPGSGMHFVWVDPSWIKKV